MYPFHLAIGYLWLSIESNFDGNYGLIIASKKRMANWMNRVTAISQLQIVRLGLRLVTYLNHCSRCGQLFAHILWWRRDNWK